MSGQSTSEVSRVAEQWGTTVEGMCRNYGGGYRKLQVAVEHRDVKKRFYELLDELAAERERMLSLIERGPKWTVQIGTFATTEALIEAILSKGHKMSDRACDLLGKIELAKEPTAVEAFEISAGDVGFTKYVRCDRFYKEVDKLGFAPIQPEVGPQSLLQYGHELVIGESKVIASEPIVDSSGDRSLLGVGRNVDGVWLYWSDGDPDDRWDPDDRFLFRRK